MRRAGPRWALATCALVGIAIVGCDTGSEPQIAIGMDGCVSCGMQIPKANEACAYTVDKEVHTFCSSGCLVREYESRRQAGLAPPDALFFADYETGELVRENAVTFLLTERVPTVMEWGILNFGDRERATRQRQGNEVLLDWQGLRTLLGDVDRTVEVVLTPSGLEPEVVVLEKGELAEWVIRGRDLVADATISLHGYEELGEIVVPLSGDPVTIRMLAVRPGAGFPLVLVGTDTVLGQVRVRGAHTADEAAP